MATTELILNIDREQWNDIMSKRRPHGVVPTPAALTSPSILNRDPLPDRGNYNGSEIIVAFGEKIGNLAPRRRKP